MPKDLAMWTFTGCRLKTSWVTGLVYYRKGNETWEPCRDGLQHPGWAAAPSFIRRKKHNDNSQSFTDRAEIIIPGIKNGEKVKFLIYDELGRNVRKGQTDASPYIIYRNSLTAGVYLLMVLREDDSVGGRTKVVIADRWSDSWWGWLRY